MTSLEVYMTFMFCKVSLGSKIDWKKHEPGETYEL